MTTMVTRQIAGYDPATERVAFEYTIPSEKWRGVFSIVHNNEEHPDYIYNYPLDIGLANDIMGLMGQRVSPNLKYFLECEAAS